MRTRSTLKVIAVVGACMFLGVLAGCAGMEYAPKRTEAAALANALCPAKPVPVMAPPPPPPPPAPEPGVTLSANPPAIASGKCATLSWSSENASGASINQGIGEVEKSGSREVCPTATMLYTISATGESGSKTASATVTVNPPPPPPVLKVIDRLVLHANFDTDKSTIRKADIAEMQKAVAFVKKYPGYDISVEGHTDSVGTDKYNQALSERRGAAAKKYLVENGAAQPDKIKPVGYGESRPIAENKTAKGKFQNRRVEILILSE